MAKNRRGETSSFSSIPAAPDSSDDEAPEEVTFGDAKTQALRGMKEALDAARREKELLKEKRRRRQELFQEQKSRRVFPADVLQEIRSKKLKPHQDEAEAGKEATAKDASSKKRLATRRGAHARRLNGNYAVMTAKERSSASVQQQAAEHFIQSRLYGPGSCRTTNNELLSLQNKKGTNKSAAVQFIKKGWACKEKAKAERLKKRWLHKQRTSFC
ncbi:U3 small nucleolar RNA-associated protein NOL7 [Brachionichthys hirsutus]|uniref:U3 small nucleolar RNA-associated protein NOL7 n=1 Tax=Brachionichthys hirsutus TaxID=412623 RepID=UPI0036044382